MTSDHDSEASGTCLVLILLIFLWMIQVHGPLFSGTDILGETQEQIGTPGLVCWEFAWDQLCTGMVDETHPTTLGRALQPFGFSWYGCLVRALRT